LSVRCDDDVITALDERAKMAVPECSRSAFALHLLRQGLGLPPRSVSPTQPGNAIEELAPMVRAARPQEAPKAKPPAPAPPPGARPQPKRSDYPHGAGGDLRYNAALRVWNNAGGTW
jgi:hypothetical protein